MSCNAVLMIHGAGGGGWEWTVWRAVFEARGLRVIAPDLGPGPEGLAATSFDDYRAQVDAALQALPRPRALVGASLGGLLAIEAAPAADALVLVNPLPPAPWHAALQARCWPDIVAWGTGARLAGTRRALPDADAVTALHALHGWRDESGAVMCDAFAGRAAAVPAIPTLCMASRRDDDVPPTITRALADAWDADFAWSEARSHVGPLLGESAAHSAGLAAQWLQRLRTARAPRATSSVVP